jgi:uridylate kinase
MVEKVFAVSGSVITGNLEKLGEIAEALETDEQILVVTGAGGLKEYIYASGEYGNQGEQDLVGIAATRLNARTLMTAMEASHPDVPETAEEIRVAASTGMDVVMGGLTPGHSTDAVAAIAAEILDADLYIATSIDGVYDRDPEDKDANYLEEVTVEDLKDIVSGNNEAGKHELIDSTALEIIERSNISTKVFEASLENLGNPEGCKGSEIVTE